MASQARLASFPEPVPLLETPLSLEFTGSAGRFKLWMANDGSLLQRILIVEDEENARKGYEALLRKWNCEILGVASGEDALAKFPEVQPAGDTGGRRTPRDERARSAGPLGR